ncbi:MAG: HEAT repeat domain-containing protein [Ktedonobacterales bacterium]
MANDGRADRGRAQPREKRRGTGVARDGHTHATEQTSHTHPPTRSDSTKRDIEFTSQRPSHGRKNAARDTGSASDMQGYLGASAPLMPAPNWKRRLYIDRPADLAALAADLSRAHVIAIDAEFSQVRSPRPDEPSHRLALLQLAYDNDYAASYVVDTLRLADLSPLRAPLEHPNILKLFHGIGADARVLATRGLIARHTLDLEAVSRAIFGQRESGLQTMLQRTSGIRLDKSLQRADWSRRPLTPAMVAYAARDAEMTLALYSWLSTNYLWAISLYETPADEPLPPVAPWILPYLEGARPRPAALAVAEAGLAENLGEQERAAREALTAVRHPNQRARVIRLITDLELTHLAPELQPYLGAPAAEERAGAARALGRLRDKSAAPLLQRLLDDPVLDVRQAAQLALENLTSAPRPSRAAALARIASSRTSGGPIRWTSETTEHDAATDESGWRAALRATFGVAETPEDTDPDPHDDNQ